MSLKSRNCMTTKKNDYLDVRRRFKHEQNVLCICPSRSKVYNFVPQELSWRDQNLTWRLWSYIFMSSWGDGMTSHCVLVAEWCKALTFKGERKATEYNFRNN